MFYLDMINWRTKKIMKLNLSANKQRLIDYDKNQYFVQGYTKIPYRLLLNVQKDWFLLNIQKEILVYDSNYHI